MQMEAVKNLIVPVGKKVDLKRCEWAPWYVIPADKKWVAHAAISDIILSQIQNLNLTYPALTEEQSKALEKAKVELQKEYD